MSFYSFILKSFDMKEPLMKYLITLFLVAQIALYFDQPFAQTQNYNDSSLNYQNSDLNYENSPLNYKNSPLNYKNSALNYDATNGLYDNNGNRIGYETRAPSGVTNFYDSNGNRIGYSPSKNK